MRIFSCRSKMTRFIKKQSFYALVVAGLFLTACGDDSSGLAPQSDDDSSVESSSSVIPDSSGDLQSSSSVKSSSSFAKSSSSSKIATSSSSSSEGAIESSSSVKSSSSSASPETAWDYLNPNIDYGEMVDERDGQIYKTVKIGDQEWMAQNLNYETKGGFCYNDMESNCAKYGRLYTWTVAMDGAGTWSTNSKGCGDRVKCTPTFPVRGVCPKDWHLPSKAEWEMLFTSVGGIQTAAKVLKSTSGWWGYGGDGTDDFGFSALPAGFRNYNPGVYSDKRELDYALFWSSTEYNSDDAYYVSLYYMNNTASLDDTYKHHGFSVRCVMDNGEVPPVSSSSVMSSSSSVMSSSSEKSSSSVKSSSSFVLATPCKTETEDNCEYGELVDERDGQRYKTVKIGDQVWMGENLNFETDGSSCYEDSVKYCEIYGLMYTWAAAVGKLGDECGYNQKCSLPAGNIQGVCPDGWHLPSMAEWTKLFRAVGGESIAGKVLAATSGWYGSGNGTDNFGFSAIPSGNYHYNSDFDPEGSYTRLWSSTEDSDTRAFYVHLFNGNNSWDQKSRGKSSKHSVRCLKD